MNSFLEESFKPLSNQYGIPVELILEIVIDLMQHCFDNEDDAVRTLRNMGSFQRAVLKVKLYRHTELRARQRSKFVADLEDMLNDKTDEQLINGYNEANFYRG